MKNKMQLIKDRDGMACFDRLSLKIERNEKRNEIEFWHYANTNDCMATDILVVHDRDCELSKKYRVGMMACLGDANYGDWEKVLITSFDQVIDAYKTGVVWF